MHPVAAEIRRLIKQQKLGVHATLTRAGVSTSFLTDMDKKPEQNPRTDTLAKVAAQLGVTSDSILARAQMLKATGGSRPMENYSADVSDRAPADVEHETIVESDVRVKAGGGAIVDEEGARRTWRMPKGFLEELRVRPRRAQLVEIEGDSMAPVLMPGDLALVDFDSTNPFKPAIYVLFDGYATVCKRVEMIPGTSDPPMLRIASANKDYAEYEVPADSVKIVGRVVWYGRRV